MANSNPTFKRLSFLLEKHGIITEESEKTKVADVVSILREKTPDDVVYDSENVRKLINLLETNDDGKITIQDFLNMARNILEGKLPKPSINLTDDELQQYEKANFLQKIYRYPWQTFEQVKYSVLLKISKKSSSWFKSLIPTSQIQTLCYIYIYSLLTKDLLISAGPYLLFHFFFLLLIVLTMDLLHDKSIATYFGSLQDVFLLKEFEGKKEEEEIKFLWESFSSYLWFFAISLLISLVHPLCPQSWMFSSLYCVVSLLFTFSTIRAYHDTIAIPEVYFDILVVTLSLVRMLTRHQDVLSDSIFTMPVNSYVSLDINVASIIQIITITLLLLLAIKESFYQRNGFFLVCCPTVVSLIWSQLFIEFFERSTWSGLFQVSAGWLLAIVAVPVLLIYLLTEILGYILGTFVSLTAGQKFVWVVIAFSVTMVCLKLLYKRRNSKRLFLGALLGAFSAYMITAGISSINESPSVASKEFSVQRFCLDYENNNLSVDEKKMRAVDYIGKPVRWEGILQSKGIFKVTNSAMDIIMKFPTSLHPLLKCIVGRSKENFIASVQADSCSLRHFNKPLIVFTSLSYCENTDLVLKLHGNNRQLKDFERLHVNDTIVFGGVFIQQYVVQLSFIGTPNDGAPKDRLTESVGSIMLGVSLQSLKFIFGPLISLHDGDKVE